MMIKELRILRQPRLSEPGKAGNTTVTTASVMITQLAMLLTTALTLLAAVQAPAT